LFFSGLANISEHSRSVLKQVNKEWRNGQAALKWLLSPWMQENEGGYYRLCASQTQALGFISFV
jgi:hypothetical protein